MTSHDINSASTNYEGNSFLSSKLIEEAVVASPTESTATTAKNEVADALDGLSPESPVLQSKDIVITYALMLLSLFDDTLRDLRSYGYGADSEQDAKKSSHAFRILSSLFAVEPLKQSYVVPPPSLASSATDSYEKWTRNVLEAVCWFNSLAADGQEKDSIRNLQTVLTISKHNRHRMPPTRPVGRSPARLTPQNPPPRHQESQSS
ncbi:hypothetical protein BC830DRAFT_803430 [Chytriomyces sp. MP71]|nr:hypothetical protein BC830DRAFT_803430 [Chytriomyces sp. MP71]